jgi:hypothetical protein
MCIGGGQGMAATLRGGLMQRQAGFPSSASRRTHSIVEISAFVAAPLGGMTLAQLGAEVIRIDPIGGNIDHSTLANHGRRQRVSTGQVLTRERSLSRSTFKSEEGQAIAAEIIASAGTLDHQSARPRLAELRPNLVQSNGLIWLCCALPEPTTDQTRG